MPQEDHVRERDQEDLFQQRRLQSIYCMKDQSTAVVKRNDVDALGQAGFQRCKFRFDAADYFLCVRAVADDDNTAHDILASPWSRTPRRNSGPK